MHSPSQSLWSSDGEEVHSVTLEFFFFSFRLVLFIGIRTITVLLVLRARYWRGGRGARRPFCALTVHKLNSFFFKAISLSRVTSGPFVSPLGQLCPRAG